MDFNVWGVANTAPSTIAEHCVPLIRRDLFAWYGKQRRNGGPCHELQDLTAGMLGKHTERSISSKGAETNSLLFYCTHLAHRYVNQLGTFGPHLCRVGDALCRIHHLLQSGPYLMPPPMIQQLVDMTKQAAAHREDAGTPSRPKWHLMLHLVHH